MQTVEKAHVEIARGRLWRAKELLQGSLANCYDLELYEEYGKLLLRMGDLPAAGKFLFLSGERKPEYEDAIVLYLGKHKGSPAQLFQSFPRKARLIVLSTYPSAVEHDLRQLGFPDNLSLFPGIPRHREVDSNSGCTLGTLAGIVVVLLVLFVLVLLILGGVKLQELHRAHPIIR